jgi:hypothetical protein
MSNEVLINEVQEVQTNEVQEESSDQKLVVNSKSWFERYEQFLYGTIVGGAAVIFTLSVRSLLRSK